MKKKSFLRRLTCVKPSCCSHIFPLHYEFVPLSFSYDTKGDLIRIHVKTDDIVQTYTQYGFHYPTFSRMERYTSKRYVYVYHTLTS